MKSCIKCGVGLNGENTTWYRQKNYIHKCNECIRIEKREYVYLEPTAVRSRKHRNKLRALHPKRYSAIQMVSSASKRAKALNLQFDINAKFLESICPDICPILGTNLRYGGGEKQNNSASIDRIDSSRGYTKDNVQVISLQANLMKSNADAKDLLRFAQWIMNTYGINLMDVA